MRVKKRRGKKRKRKDMPGPCPANVNQGSCSIFLESHLM